MKKNYSKAKPKTKPKFKVVGKTETKSQKEAKKKAQPKKRKFRVITDRNTTSYALQDFFGGEQFERPIYDFDGKGIAMENFNLPQIRGTNILIDEDRNIYANRKEARSKYGKVIGKKVIERGKGQALIGGKLYPLRAYR